MRSSSTSNDASPDSGIRDRGGDGRVVGRVGADTVRSARVETVLIRRVLGLLAVFTAVFTMGLSAFVTAPEGRAVPGTLREPVGPTARAAITFDADTGRVIDAHNHREPVLVASTIKLFTALIVQQKLAMDDEIPITARAAGVSPLKLTMEPGSEWKVGDLLHSMLIASLNDTAMALAIAAGDGSLAGFEEAVAEESRRLGLADDPKVQDPAGLDGPESVGGGNLISARDLAIVTRAFLADPELTRIVGLPEYHFHGGDDRPHVVYNHNAFLTIYPGAIGLKTGYTERSGYSLVAAATRDGRTLVTVVIGSTDPVGYATAHLDAAFAAGPDTPGTGDVLPERTAEPEVADEPTDTSRPTRQPAEVPPVEASGFGPWFIGGVMVVALGVLATLTLGVRRRARAATPRFRSDRR